jgi:hypothetical protein
MGEFRLARVEGYAFHAAKRTQKRQTPLPR